MFEFGFSFGGDTTRVADFGDGLVEGPFGEIRVLEIDESFVGEFNEAFGEKPSERHFDVVFVAVFERFEAVEDEEKVVEIYIKVEQTDETSADGEFVFGFQKRFDFLVEEVRFVTFNGLAETGNESVDRAPVVEKCDLRVEVFEHFRVG